MREPPVPGLASICWATTVTLRASRGRASASTITPPSAGLVAESSRSAPLPRVHARGLRHEVVSAGDATPPGPSSPTRPSPRLAVCDWNSPASTGSRLCRRSARAPIRRIVYMLSSPRTSAPDLGGRVAAGSTTISTKPFRGLISSSGCEWAIRPASCGSRSTRPSASCSPDHPRSVTASGVGARPQPGGGRARPPHAAIGPQPGFW